MSCETIINKIIRSDYAFFKEWNDSNKSGRYYKKIQEVRNLLHIISGGKKAELIKSVLTEDELSFVSGTKLNTVTKILIYKVYY